MNQEQKELARVLAIAKKIEKAEPGKTWDLIILEIVKLRKELALYKKVSAMGEQLLLDHLAEKEKLEKEIEAQAKIIKRQKSELIVCNELHHPARPMVKANRAKQRAKARAKNTPK